MVRRTSSERISIGPVHAAAATGHKPVQVGATDQSELRTQRHRGDNIGTVHNAGINHHLGIHPYFTHYLREQVEGYGRTVQLTTGRGSRAECRPHPDRRVS